MKFPATSKARRSGEGLRFQLAWPAEPPKNRQVQLFVRFTSSDGSKINADMPIDVRSPADPPRADPEAKHWSASESASRPKRERAPGSRLKSSRVSAAPATRRVIPPAKQIVRPHRARVRRASAGDQPRQSSRDNRPSWKPYR